MVFSLCGALWIMPSLVKELLASWEVELQVYKLPGGQLIIFFLHCLVASELWTLVFALCGALWVMPSSMKELFARRGVGVMRHHNSESAECYSLPLFFFFLMMILRDRGVFTLGL